jgi:hypothetical protein
MKNISKSIVMTLFLLGAVAGCTRTAPVYNVTSDNFSTPSAPLSERAAQIKRAGVGLRFAMEDAGPGKIKATYNARGHQAVVMVSFNQSSFSIQYVSSLDLDYDGSNIHKNYNEWIQNLERAIKAQSSIS